MSGRRRSRVLVAPAHEIAAELRRRGGDDQWYLVAAGELDRAAVIKQTAYRLREGKLKAFPPSDSGHWEVRYTAKRDREDAVAPVEMVARWVPVRPDGSGAA